MPNPIQIEEAARLIDVAADAVEGHGFNALDLLKEGGAGAPKVADLTFKDGTADGRAWRMFYDGPKAVFPQSELDDASNMAADTTVHSGEEGTWRVQAHGANNKLNGFMIGGRLGAIGERPLLANWYTAVDPTLQGGGIGESLVSHTYGQIFSQDPGSIVAAEIEHTGFDTARMAEAPSTAAMKAAVRDGGKVSWPEDQSVSFTDRLREDTGGKYTDRQQTQARYAFWTRGRQLVPETEAGTTDAAAGEAGTKPLVVKRNWQILDPTNPEAESTPSHLLLWTKDGEPITREDAYQVMRKIYTSENGYDLPEDNPSVKQLDEAYQSHPELFDQLKVAPDRQG